MAKKICAAMVLWLLVASTGYAAGPGTIGDQAGDANGINGGWYSAAMLGYITEEIRKGVFQGDPAGEGVVTPGSFSPADLRQVRLSTEYESVPVGGDGVDHRATAFVVELVTEEPPRPPQGTDHLELEILAWIEGPDAEACRTSINTRVDQTGAASRPGWFWFECAGRLGTWSEPRWSTDVSGNRVVLRIPFDSLDDTQRRYLAEGTILRGPHATSQLRGLNTLDVTREGDDFVIGSDMPADVPCTQDCPEG